MKLQVSAPAAVSSLGAIALLLAALIHAAPALPDIDLQVTVQQREAGKLSQGLHLMKLQCYQAQCVLESVSLNQCGPSPVTGKASFPLIVERNWTANGALTVADVRGTLVVEERGSDIGGSYVNTYRFGYKRNPDRLVSFSGGLVKNSTLLNRVISVEYVPLVGAYSERTLACPIRLPGVE